MVLEWFVNVTQRFSSERVYDFFCVSLGLVIDQLVDFNEAAECHAV